MDYEAEDRAATYRYGTHQDVASIRKAIYYAGFDEVQTLGGWMPVAEWKPYGQEQTLKAVAMRVNESENRIEEIPTEARMMDVKHGFVRGSWPLRKSAS